MTPALRGVGLLALLAAGSAAFGCQSIVGIEDRTLRPVDGCDEKCEACEEYCDTAMTNCTGDHAVFKTRENCVGLCNVLPLGDLGEPARGNTIACRLDQAVSAGDSEPETHCNGAGPGGGNLCGSDCDSYCYLYKTVCDSPFDTDAECLDKCRALRDDPVFDVNGYYDTDTVECRIIHFANATVLGKMHCGHGAFQSSEHCFPPKTDTAGNPILPTCEDYCRVAMVACQDEESVYDDVQTCLSVCAELPPGVNGDTHENTVGCRHYHSYNSILGSATHCSHAGPGGAGHCGEIVEGEGNCESYCILAQAGCPTQYMLAFPGGDDECHAACAAFPGAGDDSNTTSVNETEQYSVALAESADPAFAYQCRLLHTTRAIRMGGEPLAECNAVFGVAGSACPP